MSTNAPEKATLHPVAAQFQQLHRELNGTFLERSSVIHAILLAILAGEHVFILGPPGTAKSQMVRAIVGCIKRALYFECAMSKTRPLESWMGPVDLRVLRETGEYKLKRNGYASKVHFWFCDEAGKMSPVSGHDMLALANERIYYEVNGDLSVHEAPLSTMFAASNEDMTSESDDAAALWDRLLVRTTVDYLQDDDNFKALITSDMANPTVEIDWDELKDVIDNVVPAVTLDGPALKGMVSLRHEFRRNHLNPSDRRWRWSVKVLKAAAFLDGRDHVVEDDLAVLRWTLWDTVEQIDKVERLCMIAANPYVERLLDIRSAIKEVDDAITERVGPDANGNDQTQARRQYGKDANKKLKTARDQLDSLLMEAEGRRIPGFKDASEQHKRVLRRVFTVCLEQSDAETDVMMQTRLGQGDGGNV